MARQGPPALNLYEFLPYQLSVLDNKVSRKLSHLYGQRFGLTIPQWRVMAVLGQSPGLSADEVGQRTQMDKVTVSRAVARLIKDGHLHRGYAETDKRRSVLSLTEAGYAAYAQIVPLARRFHQRLVNRLSKREQHTLGELLTKLDANADSL